MLKRKCSFTDILKVQYPVFRAGRYDWEAECLTCGGGTLISVFSVANKGALVASGWCTEHSLNIVYNNIETIYNKTRTIFYVM